MFKKMLLAVSCVAVLCDISSGMEMTEDAKSRDAYRTYSSDSGFEHWKSDAECFFSEDNLDVVKTSGVDSVYNTPINFGNWLLVTYNSGLFYGYWSPGWEQRAALNFIREKVQELRNLQGNKNIEDMISRLSIILTYADAKCE